MTTQHTSGPWDAAIQDGCHAVIASISDTPKAVAVVGNHTPKDGRQAERFANARLISAAPDLLAFAKEWLERQGTDENYMVAKARAAIAKAEGGQA